MKRFFLTAVLFITIIGTAFADVVSFVTSAPRSVVVDQQFRISYKVNRVKVGEPTIPEIDGFRILTGPHRSTQRSMQMINGETTTSESVTFTYTLLAEKEGEFTIPAASIIVDGEKVTSNEAKIRVLPADQAGQSSQQGRSNGGGIQRNTTSTNISNDDLFIKASLNKTKVYEQEAVLLTYKVYSAVNLTNLDFPTPELKGFHIQEVELPKEKQFELDRYNGRNYQSLVWRQFVLFPQQSGKIEIPSLTFEGVVAVQTRRSMDPFEMMFNGGPSYVEVKKSIRTNSLTLNVEKLPAGKPAGFSGGVGKFSISSSISNNNLKTNEEVTLKVIVKGVGNMKLLGDPQIDFPSEFEVYDPIINNNFSLRSSGFTGEKVYEYVITPRSSGTYTIPAAKFSYFDTSSNSYRTIESESYTLDVEKGKDAPAATANLYIGKERGRVLATDIRHIKLDEGETKKEHTTLFGSTTYVLLYIIPLLLFIAYIIVYRRKMAENANLTLVRTKKANKVAVKRLKIANRLLKENRKNEFYDEILKTMWGYMSDKLSIPVSQLSKENIAAELAGKGVDASLIDDMQDVLNEGEFARYAPGDAGATMDKVYSRAMDVISKMENSIKK
ncbi:MAG: protein BatD [Bacteroidaceae bacterium]|nr:protein BatD [Bacteroidaceae bacterium]